MSCASALSYCKRVILDGGQEKCSICVHYALRPRQRFTEMNKNRSRNTLTPFAKASADLPLIWFQLMSNDSSLSLLATSQSLDQSHIFQFHDIVKCVHCLSRKVLQFSQVQKKLR